MKISKNTLSNILHYHLSESPLLQHFTLDYLTPLFINQAIKESNLFIYSSRYEPKINDASLGIYQLLTKTITGLGFSGNVADIFNTEIQVKYAVKYINELFNSFPEIHNKIERLKIAFASYNCGKGNMNKAIRYGLEEENIHYDCENTQQGKWSTYNKLNDIMSRYRILNSKNATINKRYINYIFN